MRQFKKNSMDLPTCKHPTESIVRHIGTTGYVAVNMIYCEACKNYLYGSFSNYSDNCYIPEAKLDKSWFVSSGEISLSDSLPKKMVTPEEIANGKISKLIPEYKYFEK